MKIRGRTIALLKFFAGQMLFPMPNQMSKHWWQKLLLTIFRFCLTRFIFCSYSRLFQLHQNGNCEGQFKHILHRLDVVFATEQKYHNIKKKWSTEWSKTPHAEKQILQTVWTTWSMKHRNIQLDTRTRKSAIRGIILEQWTLDIRPQHSNVAQDICIKLSQHAYQSCRTKLI